MSITKTREVFSLPNVHYAIFFELCEGTYLHIDKKAIGSQNAIYFFERKIANSLEDFLLRFNTEGHYFEYG